jgi:hypothetical protein
MKFTMNLSLNLRNCSLGKDTYKISLEASRFLDKKGILEKMDNYIMRTFCSHEKPMYTPYYVPNKLFIIEVVRQYKF